MSRLRLGSLFLGLVFLSGAAALWPLDLTQGRIKLTLHEGIGRFSLSYVTDEIGTAKPLLVAKDPRTSFLSIAIGDKVYRLGESREFRETVRDIPFGARFTWRSSLVTVTESFSFISSPGSPEADGVRIDLVIKNVSEQDLSIGVRYLFDTYLGEPSYVHFRTERNAEIPRELTLFGRDNPEYWVSPLVGDPNRLGLMCVLSGPGITTPDRIVFANWKRLSEAPWGYETSPTRTFSVLPYSVNDSAVSHYFDPRPLAKGAELQIVTVLGRYTKAGFTLQPAPEKPAAAAVQAAPPAAAAPAATAAPAAVSPAVSAKADVFTVDQLIARINMSLSEGVSDADLAALDAAVAELKERLGELAPAQGLTPAQGLAPAQGSAPAPGK